METRANYLLVASFVLAIIALAGVGAIWVLNLEPLPEARAYYDIYFSGSVAGLKVNAPVTLSGIPIGAVRKIENDRDDSTKVHVLIEVQKNAAIKSDSVASLDVNFVLGDASVSITAGSRDAAPPAVLPGHSLPLIASQPSPLETVATWLAEFMQRTIDVSDVLLQKLDDSNRQAIADELQGVEELTAQIARKAEGLGGTIDGYGSMAHDAHTQVAALNASLAKLTDGLQSAQSGMDGADAMIKSVDEWIRNTDHSLSEMRGQQLASFRDTMTQIEGMVSDARGVVHRLARYIDDLERDPSRAPFAKPNSGGYRP